MTNKIRNKLNFQFVIKQLLLPFNNINYKTTILWILLFIPYLLLIPGYLWYVNVLDSVKNSSFIIISKEDMKLYHYNFSGELIQNFPIACGKKFGDKELIGDNKTPEGVFTIAEVSDASDWSHDFDDDTLGVIQNAYGPYFIRLNVPGQKGIGIHGTYDPISIGTRASEGCIRMNNSDIAKLVKHINSATVVVITPSQKDIDNK